MPRNYIKLWDKYPMRNNMDTIDPSLFERRSLGRHIAMGGIFVLVFVVFVATGFGFWILLNL